MSSRNNLLIIFKNLIIYGFYICLIISTLNIFYFVLELLSDKINQNEFQFVASQLLASALVFTIVGYFSIAIYSFFLINTKYRNLYKIIIFEVLIGSFLLITYFYSGLS